MKKTHAKHKQPDPKTQKFQNYLLNEVENLRSILGVNDKPQNTQPTDSHSVAHRPKKRTVKQKSGEEK